MKHARSSDDTAFSIDMLEEFLEDWNEDNPSKSTISFEEEFDAEKDLLELEILLEEAEYNDLIRRAEGLTCRVASTDSASPFEEPQTVAKITLDSTSPCRNEEP